MDRFWLAKLNPGNSLQGRRFSPRLHEHTPYCLELRLEHPKRLLWTTCPASGQNSLISVMPLAECPVREEFRNLLKVFLDKHPEPGRVLIPGCGSGDRIEAFSSGGWDIIGIDFSAVAVARARRLLGPLADKVDVLQLCSRAEVRVDDRHFSSSPRTNRE